MDLFKKKNIKENLEGKILYLGPSRKAKRLFQFKAESPETFLIHGDKKDFVKELIVEYQYKGISYKDVFVFRYPLEYQE